MSENKSKFRPAVFPADIMYDDNLASNERWILAILFSYTNAHSNTAFPSYATLAERSGYTRKTVIEITKKLLDKGYVKKDENFRKTKEGITQTSNTYTLFYKSQNINGGNLESDIEVEPSVNITPVSELHQGSVNITLGVVSELHPNYPIELSNELSTTTTTDPEIGQVINSYEQEFGRPLTKMECEKVQDYYDDLGKDLTIEVLREAVEARIINFKYMNGIVTDWQKKGIRSIMDLEQERKQFEQRKSEKEKIRVGANSKKEDKPKESKYNNFYL